MGGLLEAFSRQRGILAKFALAARVLAMIGLCVVFLIRSYVYSRNFASSTGEACGEEMTTFVFVHQLALVALLVLIYALLQMSIQPHGCGRAFKLASVVASTIMFAADAATLTFTLNYRPLGTCNGGLMNHIPESVVGWILTVGTIIYGHTLYYTGVHMRNLDRLETVLTICPPAEKKPISTEKTPAKKTSQSSEVKAE
ncbi:unnamed protein product, partial [Mesorhabditis spiculigera]